MELIPKPRRSARKCRSSAKASEGLWAVVILRTLNLFLLTNIEGKYLYDCYSRDPPRVPSDRKGGVGDRDHARGQGAPPVTEAICASIIGLLP